MTNTNASFLLLIGDDGALLLPPLSENVKASLYASADVPNEQNAILHELAQSPQTPIIILADTQAQHIRHEELPSLPLMDRRKLLGKRLQQSFPNIEFKAYVQKKKNTATLIAIENIGALQTWREHLAILPNTCDVVCSLPVESAAMIGPLMLGAKDGWTMLLSIHKTGGIRQIVTFDGALIFTRLTAPIAHTSSAGFAAAALSLEIKATRDYLARLGLTNEMPMHLAAIVPPDLQETLRVTPLDVSNRLIFTPHEAALALKLPFTPAVDETMGEIVHALWVANSPTLKVPLIKASAQLKRRSKIIRHIGYAVAASIVAFAMLRFAVAMIDPYKVHMDLRQGEKTILKLEDQLATARAALAAETQPLDRLRKAAERERLYANASSPFLSLITTAAPFLIQIGRATQLDWANNTLTITLSPTIEQPSSQPLIVQLNQLRMALPDITITASGLEATPPTTGTLTNTAPLKPDAPAPLILTLQRRAP